MSRARIATAQPTPSALLVAGLEPGTEVMTLNGCGPVENLVEGDRIVTRTGACPLRGLIRTAAQGFILVFDTPQVVYLADGQVDSETGLPFSA